MLHSAVYDSADEVNTGTQELFNNLKEGIKAKFEELPDFVKTPLSVIADLSKVALAGLAIGAIQDRLKQLVIESTQVAIAFEASKISINSIEPNDSDFADSMVSPIGHQDPPHGGLIVGATRVIDQHPLTLG
jgi:hypothetical protein